MMDWGIGSSSGQCLSLADYIRGTSPWIGRTLPEGIDVAYPLLDVAAGERVFDVGCGDGTGTREMARCVGSRRGTRVSAKHTERT